ncbi:MAG: PadR family transcriptional regulator [Gemmatimonadota bacterium]
MKRHHFYILLSLAGRDRHGLDVMRDVLELTEGELKLWPATLYGSLDELVDAESIQELADAAARPAGESEKKRYYRITAAGRAALVQETRRIEALAGIARLRLTEG